VKSSWIDLYASELIKKTRVNQVQDGFHYFGRSLKEAKEDRLLLPELLELERFRDEDWRGETFSEKVSRL
jgi:hypothetical protein